MLYGIGGKPGLCFNKYNQFKFSFLSGSSLLRADFSINFFSWCYFTPSNVNICYNFITQLLWDSLAIPTYGFRFDYPAKFYIIFKLCHLTWYILFQIQVSQRKDGEGKKKIFLMLEMYAFKNISYSTYLLFIPRRSLLFCVITFSACAEN